jgi:hypothetical protein
VAIKRDHLLEITEQLATVAVMAKAIAAMVIAAVNTAVAVPTIATRHAQVLRLQLTATTAAHRAKRQPVQVALQVPSKVMRAHVKVAAIHAGADVRVATKVTAVKRALKALSLFKQPRAHKRMVPPRRHVSLKAHALGQLTPRKPTTNCNCKTAQKANSVLKTTTAAIQNASAVVVVAVVASVVKTKVQALRTKMVHPACNSQSLTLRQTPVSRLKVSP